MVVQDRRCNLHPGFFGGNKFELLIAGFGNRPVCGGPLSSISNSDARARYNDDQYLAGALAWYLHLYANLFILNSASDHRSQSAAVVATEILC